MIASQIEVKVRFSETDAMGVVYHANYLPWCELARLAMMQSINLPYEDLIKEGFHLPVIEANLSYKFPAKFADTVVIKAQIKQKPSIRIVVDYEMFIGDKLILTAKTKHVFVNDKGMPVKPPKIFVQTIENYYT